VNPPIGEGVGHRFTNQDVCVSDRQVGRALKVQAIGILSLCLRRRLRAGGGVSEQKKTVNPKQILPNFNPGTL
jgi:hypothetical protein